MENATGKTAMRHLRKHGDVNRVENRVGPGTPDMNGCIQGHEFWIENKWLDHFPRHGGVVLIPKFRQDQRAWMHRRGKAGGKVFLLLGVGMPLWRQLPTKRWTPCGPPMFLLYRWQDAVESVGHVDLVQLQGLAWVMGTSRFPTENIVDVLIS